MLHRNKANPPWVNKALDAMEGEAKELKDEILNVIEARERASMRNGAFKKLVEALRADTETEYDGKEAYDATVFLHEYHRIVVLAELAGEYIGLQAGPDYDEAEKLRREARQKMWRGEHQGRAWRRPDDEREADWKRWEEERAKKQKEAE